MNTSTFNELKRTGHSLAMVTQGSSIKQSLKEQGSIE
jgi:hypothetical protein